MADENNSSNDGSDAAIGAPAVGEAKPKDAIPSKPATEADLDKVEERMSGFERSTLRWTRASFIVVLATGVFICLQWLEIRSGGKDTHDLAVAADTQAKKMESMSDAADKIRQAAEGMVTQEQRIADNAEQTMKASAKQNDKVLDTAIAQAYLEQRAWLGVLQLTDLVIKAGEPGRGTIIAQNSGKTPALQAHTHATGQGIPKGTELNLTYPPIPAGQVISNSVVAPQGVLKFIVHTNGPLAQSEVDAAKNGDTVVYIYGTIRYADIFNRPHRTVFCFVVEKDLTTNDFCDKGNEAD